LVNVAPLVLTCWSLVGFLNVNIHEKAIGIGGSGISQRVMFLFG